MRTYLPLSAQRIKNSRPGQRDRWLSDSNGARSFGRLLLRISPNGVRRFYFRFSVSGLRRTVPLGVYSHVGKPGHVTLSQAREIAARLASQTLPLESLTALANEPGNLRLPAVNAAANKFTGKDLQTVEGNRTTLLELCRAYLKWQDESKKVSAKQTKNIIKNYIERSDLAHTPASAIKSSQISSLLRSVIDEGKGRTAAKIRSVLHAAYGKALGAPLSPSSSAEFLDPSLESNPVTAVGSLSDLLKPRHRTLKKPELAEFWRQMQFNEVNSSIVSFRALRLSFLLGGQRCEQLVRVPINDVDLDAKIIRLEDFKGNRTEPRIHIVPLTETTLEEVQWLLLHSRAVGSPFLFASHIKGKRLLASTVSNIVTAMCQRMLLAKTASAHFQFSDLRRTVETTLSALGVSKDHRAQLLSHGISGIQARHYDMYDYLAEKRQALAIWEDYLRDL